MLKTPCKHVEITAIWQSCLVLLLILVAGANCLARPRVDADFPGGNISLVNISDDEIHVQPDLRDTNDWWFYWNFRVRGAAGRKLKVCFDGRNPMGARGPAVSLDRGATWSWLGIEHVVDTPQDASFRYAVPAEIDEVRFAFCPPYTTANLHAFLPTIRPLPEVSVATLCRSEKDRDVELIRITPRQNPILARVLLTARHHACEAMASYVLEGVLSAVCSPDDTGKWLRRQIEFEIVPFMDKDGVEEGDQGKNRLPHDHWLDYEGSSRYRSVAALRQLPNQGGHPPMRLMLDLHCSYLREAVEQPGCSERVFFMGSMAPKVAAETAVLQRILTRDQRGPILYSGRFDLPHGARWNTKEIAAPSILGWASRLPEIWSAAVLEVPYANAGGVAVTPDTARSFGGDLARAIKTYFESRSAADR